MAVKPPTSPFQALDPVTTQLPVQDWPQTENANVYEHSIWQRVAAPVRYGPPVGMLACVTDASQITKTNNAGGSVTNDTTDPVISPASVVLSAPGSNGTIYCAAPTAGRTFNLSAAVNSIHLPMKIHGTANITTLKLSVSSDAFGSGNYHTVVIAFSTAAWHTDDRWFWFSWAGNEFTAVGAGADLTAINRVRWEVQGANAAGALTLEVGPVFVRPQQTAKALCVISGDDGYGSGWTQIAQRMIPYGFPGVLFPKANVIGQGASGDTGNIAIREMMALRDYHGWQIGTHTWANIDHLNYYNGDALAQFMNKERLWQQAMGLQYVSDDFAWSGVIAVNGVHFQDQDHWDQVRKNFRSARTTYGKNATAETCPPADPYRLRCYLWGTETWGSGSPTNDAKVYVDKVIAAKGLAYFCIHNQVGPQGNAGDTAAFASLLAYLDSNRSSIDVVTIDTAIARMNALA